MVTSGERDEVRELWKVFLRVILVSKISSPLWGRRRRKQPASCHREASVFLSSHDVANSRKKEITRRHEYVNSDGWCETFPNLKHVCWANESKCYLNKIRNLPPELWLILLLRGDRISPTMHRGRRCDPGDAFAAALQESDCGWLHLGTIRANPVKC